MIDKNTFGHSKAEETLANILEKRNDKKLLLKVSKLLNMSTNQAKNIYFKNNKYGTQELIYHWFKDHYFNVIDSSIFFNLEENKEIKSYLKNCLKKRLLKIFKK